MAQRKKTESAAPSAAAPAIKAATQIEWIAMDLGNGFSKLLCSGLASPIRWRSVQGRVGHRTRIKELPFDAAIHWRNAWYVFGERAYTECPDTLEDFPTTDRYLTEWYKRTFAYALHQAYGLRLGSDGPLQPEIVASIPAREYSNSARKDAIHEHLCGLYQIGRTQGPELEIEVSEANLTLIPEGAGSYLHMVAQKHTEMEQGLWAILDLGYLTGDVIFFRNGEYVADLSDSDDKLGMISVAQQVAAAVRGQGGPDLSEAEIDAYIAEFDPRTEPPCIEISGTSYDVSDAYHETMTELGDRAVTFLKKRSAGKNLKGVLLTGGNAASQAYFIQPQTQKMPPVTVCSDGENGNVIGAATMVKG